MIDCWITKNLLFYIGYCFFGVIDKLLINQMSKDYQNNYIEISSVLILIMFISEFLISIIFLFICCSNQENEEIEESNNLLNQNDSIIVDNNNNDDRKYFDWKIQ